MNLDWLNGASQKELEQFKSVCNQLLSRTYLVRTLYKPGKGRVNNPDYTFLSIHFDAVQEYLGLLDWDLRRDDFNGYFYVLNTDEANRCNLSKKETAILLALRLIYEENQERLGIGAGRHLHGSGCIGESGNGLCHSSLPSRIWMR